MVAKIKKTNFSNNRYLKGLLCKLYWRTIHGSWWKPIERSSWTKNCQRTWAINEEDCFDLLLVKMEVWDQGEKSHTALWTINLKNQNQICCSFNLSTPPRCPPSRPRGRAGEGRRTRRAPPSRGRGRCLRSSTFADRTPGRRACSILSGAKNVSSFSLDPPLSGNLCEQPLFATFRARWVQSGLDWSLKQSSTSRARPGQDSSEKKRGILVQFCQRPNGPKVLSL